MKKLIITETQEKYLKSYLFELDNSKTVKPNQSDEELRNFIKEVRDAFNSSISNADISDFITFIFGVPDKDNNWPKETTSEIVMKITSVENNIVNLDFVVAEGKNIGWDIYKQGDKFRLYLKTATGFNFYKQKTCVTFSKVDENNKDEYIRVCDFLAYQVTDGDIKTNAFKVAEEAHNKWLENNQKFIKSMIYEPSFLGMDNFFFFPTGYLAMDKTLAKFGLHVDKHLATYNKQIKIRIKDEDIVGGDATLQKGAVYIGYINQESDLFKIKLEEYDTDFIFYIDNQDLATNGNYYFRVGYQENGKPEKMITGNRNGKFNVNIVNLYTDKKNKL